MNTELTAIAVEDQRQDIRDHSDMKEQELYLSLFNNITIRCVNFFDVFDLSFLI
jgi:hypothetical protein